MKKAAQIFRVIPLRKIALFLIVLLAGYSCKKDDEVGIKNRMVIDGKTFELVSGFFDNDPEEQSTADIPPQHGFAQEVLLLGPGLTMNTSTGIVSGKGNAVVFNPFTSEIALVAGNFELPVPYTEKIGFLLDAYGCEGYDAGTDDCDVEYEGDSGTLTISVSGDVYTLKFTGKMTYEDNDGNEITVDVDLFFEGSLKGVDL